MEDEIGFTKVKKITVKYQLTIECEAIWPWHYDGMTIKDAVTWEEDPANAAEAIIQSIENDGVKDLSVTVKVEDASGDSKE